VSALRPGAAAAVREPIDLTDGEARTLDLTLDAAAPAGNMLRNSDFALRWLRPDAPDCWRKLPEGAPRPGWESDNVSVTPGARYRVGVEPMPGQHVTVAVRWRWHPVANQEGWEETLVDPRGQVVTAPATAKYLEVLLLGGELPSLYRRAWCLPEPWARRHRAGLPAEGRRRL
jgi:hypothetical protein